ncbi:hypothetical protein BLNAU_15892 [Blattamonas nauphoetae]|uniref:Uncharacterized protein n=1 Tax=Blattamonas nauphoetae TaxID=2049346 RepID=A0ABQ9XFX5_9EUKA|nr:hypothetical protein BLNAU_15892 [Blattamonas nauphoetae]
MQPLDSYLFRSSAYSLFGHIIVNSLIFAKSKMLGETKRCPSFLNVVTGTPGMGKSASRYPFITLLMSSGVKKVTTQKKGEGTFVLVKCDTKETGTVKIKTEVNGHSIEFDTPSYLYTYKVVFFDPVERSDDKNREQTYTPTKYKVDPKPSKIPPDRVLGEISVPSVEYFPYFVRLMMGTDSERFDRTQLEMDTIIAEPSILVHGSHLAEGSILFKNQWKTVDGPFTAQERIVLRKGSDLSEGSYLFQNSTDPDQFIDESGEILISVPTQADQVFPTPGLTKFDQIVEAESFFNEGSRVKYRAFSTPPRPHHRTRKIERNCVIEAGSVLKKGSIIAAQSTLSYYSIQNYLKDTSWHVIDDLHISVTNSLNPDDFHLLLSSPKGSRWKQVTETEKTRTHIIIEYVFPKYTPQEEAAFLNTMNPPSKGEIKPTGGTVSKTQNGPTVKPKSSIQRGVEIFSFIPRFVMDSKFSTNALSCIAEAPKTSIPQQKKDIFAPDVSHKLIHFSCPQFDCTNWHTEFATDMAKRHILREFGVQAKMNYVNFLLTVKNHSDHSQEKGAAFHTFVSDAIAQGFIIYQPKYALSQLAIQKPVDLQTVPIQLPPTLGETYVILRGPSNMKSAELPDLKTINSNNIPDYNKQYDCLFENCMKKSYITSRELAMGDGETGASQDIPPPNTPLQDVPRGLKCFTFYLNPLGANNVGFDSIILFFQVYDIQGQLTIHKLSVMFIQSTLSAKHALCNSGPNLMFLWLCLLSKVYDLSSGQIYPYLFYVRPPLNVKLNYGFGASTAFFMDPSNIWEMSYDPDVECVSKIKNKGRLMVNCIDPLPVNRDPYHFRCYFCGLILEEMFVDHDCQYIETKITDESSTESVWTIASSDVNIGMFDHSAPVEGAPLEEIQAKFVFNLRSTTPGGGNGPSRDQKQVFALTLQYSNKGYLPNISKGPGTFDVMDVTMVPFNQPMKLCHPPAVVELTQTARGSVCTVHPTQPLPHFFSLVPPISKDSVEKQPIGNRPQFEFGLAADASKPDDSADMPALDVVDPKSHLYATIQMIQLWLNGYQITFSETGEIVPGQKVARNRDIDDLDLWVNANIPVCPMHVPMSYFGRLPVFVKETRCFTQFDIKSLLLPPDQPPSQNPSDSPPSQNPSDLHPSSQSMFEDYIENGKPLPPTEVIRLLKMKTAKTPLISADVAPLSAQIPHLQSVNEYDLQLLISLVNGSQNRILEELRNCCKYLDSPSKIPEDKRTLSEMKLILRNGFSAAHQRLEPLLNCLTEDDRTFFNFEKDSFEFKCLENDALLPRSRQDLLIPWVMENATGRAQLLLQDYHPSEPLQHHERWLLIAAMMVRTPISESDKAIFDSTIQKISNDTSKNALESFVNQYSDQISQNDPTSWTQTLNNIREKGFLEESDIAFLQNLFSTPPPELGNTRDLIDEIKHCSAHSRDKEMLISLVCGFPRLSEDLRQEIEPTIPPLTDSDKQYFNKKIEDSKDHTDENKLYLKTFVNEVTSFCCAAKFIAYSY